MNPMRSAAVLRLFIVVITCAAPVHADEIDVLIGKLVSKGILTQADASEIKAEMISEAGAGKPTLAVQDLSTPPPVQEVAARESGWWDRLDFKGDLRTRHQSEKLKGVALVDDLDINELNRWRIRWRAGVVADVNEKWEVGFGLTSGGSDGRSTNQTLRGAFSTGDARLDYAYARYNATENVDLLAGKFKTPLWFPKDLLWDSDLRPDGLALPMQFTVADRVEMFVTPAYLVLAEDFANRRDDASVFALQAGANFEISDAISLKLAPSLYDFSGMKGTPGPVSLSVPSNSRDSSGNLIYDYDAVVLAAELGIAGTALVPKVKLFGEWVNTFDPDDDNTGWMLGFAFGDAKVNDARDWQVKYNYRRLEADAWPEFLADSDHFFGATNVKGGELELVVGIARGVNVSLDYYGGAKFLGTDVKQDLLQLDLNLKW
jgi:hypothetical protein